jgi:hypothetical protein
MSGHLEHVPPVLPLPEYLSTMIAFEIVSVPLNKRSYTDALGAKLGDLA